MQSVQTNAFLGEEKISRLLRKFSVPCILSLLVSALYNIVDQIFVGNSELGYLGNAATGIVFPILIIALGFAWCFGDGAAAYLSILQGRRDTAALHRCVGTGITLTLLVSVVLAVVFGVWREPLLRLFGASDATVHMAAEYFTILLWALPIYLFSNMLNSVIRADGGPVFAMASMIAGALVNIALDPLFIFGFHWGIAGAAYATVIGQFATFVLSFVYLFRTKTFRLTLKSLVPDLKAFLPAVRLGVSTFITQISIVVISLVCNTMLYRYGMQSVYGPDIPISVISIETKVFTVVINLVVGLTLGGQPILGYNYGAGNYRRVKETFLRILALTVLIGLVSTAIFEICPQLVIGIFGSGSALYDEFAQMTFRIFLSLVTFTCIIKMSSIFLQAIGQPVKAVAVSLVRDIVCFVPLVIFLPQAFGIRGALYAAPAADFIGMIVTAIVLVSFFRSLGKAPAIRPQTPEAAAPQAVIRPSHKGVIVTIAREHGSAGKQVGLLVAEKLGVACYYKETAALAAKESGLDQAFISDINKNSPSVFYDLYLSTQVVQQAVAAQETILRRIAENGSCVIVGRAADYVLRENADVVRIFIHAPKEYRVRKVMEMYGDTEAEAAKSVARSDAARAGYYRNISGLQWGNVHNYDLCIDSSIGAARTAETICAFLAQRG